MLSNDELMAYEAGQPDDDGRRWDADEDPAPDVFYPAFEAEADSKLQTLLENAWRNQ